MDSSKLYSILDSAGDAAFVVDLTGEILNWSPKAEELLGFPANRVLHHSCAEILDGRNEAGHNVCRRECTILAKVRRHAPPAAFDLEVLTSSGGRKWLNVSTMVVSVKQGTRRLVVHLMRDVEQEKRMHETTRRILFEIGRLTGQEIDQVLHRKDPDPSVDLTPREVSVVEYLAGGHSTRGIAVGLGISESTARNHIQHAMEKLHCHSRLAAVAAARTLGVI